MTTFDMPCDDWLALTFMTGKAHREKIYSKSRFHSCQHASYNLFCPRSGPVSLPRIGSHSVAQSKITRTVILPAEVSRRSRSPLPVAASFQLTTAIISMLLATYLEP